MDPERPVNFADMIMHGVRADEQLVGNLLLGKTRKQPAQDAALRRRKDRLGLFEAGRWLVISRVDRFVFQIELLIRRILTRQQKDDATELHPLSLVQGTRSNPQAMNKRARAAIKIADRAVLLAVLRVFTFARFLAFIDAAQEAGWTALTLNFVPCPST